MQDRIKEREFTYGENCWYYTQRLAGVVLARQHYLAGVKKGFVLSYHERKIHSNWDSVKIMLTIPVKV